MSQEKAESVPDKEIFTSKDFIDFLKNNGGPEIAKLQIRTKSGETISRDVTFHSSDEENIFKSVDLLESLFPSEERESSPAEKNPYFTSGDWKIDYANNHVDVDYDKEVFDNSGNSGKRKDNGIIASFGGVVGNNGKKKTDWNAMFKDGLAGKKYANNDFSSLIEAANRAQPHPVATKPGATQSKSDKKKKPRKVVPEEKIYVDKYTEQDVLFGRGGRSNHHPGNKMYRELVIAKQDYYRNCDKSTKTVVAQSIVDAVHNGQKGRFLEKDPATNRYYIVPNLTARRKVGQALRENNTEEARAAKREKYGKRKDGSGASVTSSTVSSLAAQAV